MGFLLGLCFVLPFVIVYFAIIKGMDRYEPEPIWLLILMFFWGAIGATAGSIVFNVIGQIFFVGSGGGASSEAATATFVAPLVEESMKGIGLLALALLSAAWLKEYDGALDGAILGGVVGLGFTLTEDVLYLANAYAENGAAGLVVLGVIRTVLSGLGHALFTAMTGIGLGIALESRSWVTRIVAPIAGWAAAVTLHFVHNLLASYLLGEGEGLIIKLMLFWLLDALFFVVLFILVVRDRWIVRRHLADDVGGLLYPHELDRTTSLFMFIPLWNYFSLSGSGFSVYRTRRRKQLDLVELAFVKARLARGEKSEMLVRRESDLRRRILAASEQRVYVCRG